MREFRFRPKLARRATLPRWLVLFFIRVDAMIQREDEEVLTASDDFLQEPGVVGGLITEGGDRYQFTVFPGPDRPVNRPRWYITLSTECIHEIAQGERAYLDLWECSNPDCWNLFATPKSTCPYCDYEDEERDKRDRVKLNLTTQQFVSKEAWALAYLAHFSEDHPMYVIGQYNTTGLGEALGWFTFTEMQSLVEQYRQQAAARTEEGTSQPNSKPSSRNSDSASESHQSTVSLTPEEQAQQALEISLLAEATPVEVQEKDQLLLPFADLPEPSPGETFTLSNRTYRVTAYLSAWLDRIDWDQFQQEIVQGVHAAAATYRERAKSERLPPIFQIAVCTSEKMRRSSINFETREHARQSNQKRLLFAQTRGIELTAQERAWEYNPDENTFLYSAFTTIEHPSLNILDRLHNDMELLLYAALNRIVASVLKTLDRMVSEGLLTEMPCEPEVWIGATSPHYWFNHLQRVESVPPKRSDHDRR